MTQGAIVNATGTIDATSDANYTLHVASGERRKRKAATDLAADAIAKRKKLALAESFPLRMKEAMDAMAEKGSQVNVCKTYLMLLKEEATSNGNKQRWSDLHVIDKKVSAVKVKMVGEIFNAQAAVAAAAAPAAAVVVVTAPIVAVVGDDALASLLAS
jgi:hypothetical protein